MKLLFISDLHLGDGSKADDFGNNDDKFVDWILKISPDNIYLVGDIYELWQFKIKRIETAHRDLCKFLKQCNSVIGNHDYKLFGKSKIVLKYNNKKILIVHGHQNDERMNNPVVRGFVWFLGIVERIPFMHWIDNPDGFSKKRNSADIKTEEYAIKELKKYDTVICGHTHKKGKDYIDYYGRIYANCGACMHGKFEGLIYDTEKDILEEV